MPRADSLLRIHRRSGDNTLGQTLVRLARLAEASHGFDQAHHLRQAIASDAAQRLAWETLQPTVHQPRTDAINIGDNATPMRRGAVHKEVNR